MLTSKQATIEKIEQGNTLYLAADEKVLKELPKGNWIGGTIPYFMDNEGVVSKEDIFLVEQNSRVTDTKISWYDTNNLKNIAKDSANNGFSIVIIPATSPTHLKYAQEAPDYDGIFYKQIIGWISGVHLEDLGKISPKVFNGTTGEWSDSKAIVMHSVLPANKAASIGIINIFKQGIGDTITFLDEGFQVDNCIVNGESKNFADYLTENKIDLKLPLVANYSGAMVNVSFQGIDEQNKAVNLYAPVFKDVEYRIAEPVENYIEEFTNKVPQGLGNIQFSCNCILNFLYSELEGKSTGNLTGPITFGEIAYQLLNQTLVYLSVSEV